MFYNYLINMGNLSFKYKFWIENPDGESIFGDGKYKLFKAIEETGSLKYAGAEQKHIPVGD
jgi:molybdenum-dependent DNA-binding transcriptional regulator ModE